MECTFGAVQTNVDAKSNMNGDSIPLYNKLDARSKFNKLDARSTFESKFRNRWR